MRLTVTINDDLYATAENLTGLNKKSALINESLKALVERESARRLVLLGGSEPELDLTNRRQSEVGTR
jgi:Arc/MetJ family transcription regulator